MASDEDVQTTIHRAIQSAHYNEAVIVSVSDHDTNAREIVLVACLDREHGGIIWRDASAAASSDVAVTHNSNDDIISFKQEDVGIVRHLRTKLWAIPMLNDHVRNEMYNRSVRTACQTVVRKRMEEPDNDGVIRILDIGSGTGLIAMMAARHCRDAIVEVQKLQLGRQMKVQVTSCEMASAMARLARMTIDENMRVLNTESGSDCGIVVVECHSTDEDFAIEDSRFESQPDNDVCVSSKQQLNAERPKKADICTSELLDSGLLGEGVLPSLRDAWERHLKSDALVLPQSARVVAVLIEGCPLTHDQRAKVSADNRLNGATAFYGPELQSFQHASGGVWLATSPRKDQSDNQNDGVLLGVQYDPAKGAAQSSVGGISIPLHANAILQGGLTSLANPLQEYGDYTLVPETTRVTVEDSDNKSSSTGIRVLTDPKTVLTLDFASGLNSFPTINQSTSTTFVPTSSGIIDGVLFWWELCLDTDNTYSTEPIGCFETAKSCDSTPSKRQWQDHWQQCLFVFGDGDRSRTIEVNCPIQVETSHDDFSISFAISRDDEMDVSRPAARQKLDDGSCKVSDMRPCTLNKYISPARSLQLNDAMRTSVLRDAVLFALNTKGNDAPLLDLSDIGLCAIMAAVAGGTCITSLESNTATLAATISQLGNNLPKDGDTFQVIQAQSENVTTGYIAGGRAEIVMAEPYYQILEGWHIQEALNYFYLVRSFKSRGLISEAALSLPYLACVMACVVEFPGKSQVTLYI
jgi:predicted RNA methylase